MQKLKKCTFKNAFRGEFKTTPEIAFKKLHCHY